jgi:glucose-1-phosphate thymidylyltransferase
MSAHAERASRIVGVIPAAGYATRLQPLPGSKETFSVAGRPLMDYVVDRMVQAGCDEIRVITRPEKTDVIAHVARRKLTAVLASPPSVAHSVLAGIDGMDPEDVVLLGFPDTIWEPLDGFVQLLDSLDGFEVALGLFRAVEPQRSDVVNFNRTGLVTSVQVKPKVPKSDWIWGIAAARRRALDALSGRDEPGDLFHHMCVSGSVVGVPLPGTFVDLGTRDALEAYVKERRAGQLRG